MVNVGVAELRRDFFDGGAFGEVVFGLLDPQAADVFHRRDVVVLPEQPREMGAAEVAAARQIAEADRFGEMVHQVFHGGIQAPDLAVGGFGRRCELFGVVQAGQ